MIGAREVSGRFSELLMLLGLSQPQLRFFYYFFSFFFKKRYSLDPLSPPLTHLPPKQFLSPKPLTHLPPPPTPSASGDACTPQLGVATLGRRPTVPPPTVRCFSLRLPPRPPEKKAGFALPPSLRRRLSPCLPIRESTKPGTHPQGYCDMWI